MKVKYQCYICKKENELDTGEAQSLLLEAKVTPYQPTIYITNCSHCGAENRVEVSNHLN